MSWQYEQPVHILFGNGERRKLKNVLCGSKGLLITSPSFVKSGIAMQMQEDAEGVITHIFAGVTPNPDVKECRECLALLHREHIDCIIALGGGSVIDLAKVVSVMAIHGDGIEGWMDQKQEVPTSHLPLIALPTTAGTGSEVTCVAVISDHEKGYKIPLSSIGFYPDIALIDPELTYSVPRHMSAATGFDVLCHAIEAYWSRNHQPICDALALHAIRLVLDNLTLVCENGNHVEARERMAEASIIAGLAFTRPKTTSSHACSYPLTNILGIVHGEACALTIDAFLMFNHLHGCERVQQLIEKSGFSSVEAMANHIGSLKKELDLLCDLKSFSISEETLQSLVEGSLNSAMDNNPIEVKREDLEELYRRMV